MRIPRMTGWLIIALALSVLMLALAPAQLPVTLYKINLIALAGVMGYWLDRALFPYARPDRFTECDGIQDPNEECEVDGGNLVFDLDMFVPNDLLFAAAQLRRAFIVGAAMLAMGLAA